jgi:hypothetical protein
VRVKQIQLHLEQLNEIAADLWTSELLKRPKYQDRKNLNNFEHRVFSQSGEDGIIAEIFRRVGATNKVFVECAPGNGSENNTVYLLAQGWKGLWIEADRKHVRAVRQRLSTKLREGTIRLEEEFVTAENIEAILDRASLPADFDLLSLDIDRNDYWVWQKNQRYHPRVVVIEYNAIFPPECEWIIEYDPSATWDGTSNFGASLSALEVLGNQKGYKLVGCALAGTNAFFVRDDLVGDAFSSPFTAEKHWEPPRYYFAGRKSGHRRGFAGGK